jgi:hypothetical protein
MIAKHRIRWVVLGILLAALPPALPAQSRTLKPIKPRAAAPSATDAISRETCVAAVHRIAAAWGEGRVDEVLHPEFPNRMEVVASLRQASVAAPNRRLSVEAVPATRSTAVETRGGERVAECVADVVTRVSYDDPETGLRVQKDEGRAQWRILFALPAEGERR